MNLVDTFVFNLSSNLNASKEPSGLSSGHCDGIVAKNFERHVWNCSTLIYSISLTRDCLTNGEESRMCIRTITQIDKDVMILVCSGSYLLKKIFCWIEGVFIAIERQRTKRFIPIQCVPSAPICVYGIVLLLSRFIASVWQPIPAVATLESGNFVDWL